MVIMTADTMDQHIDVGVWAWDTSDNIYLLQAFECNDFILEDEERLEQDKVRKDLNKAPVQTVADLMNKEYLVNADGVGIKPTFCVVDQGGHRRR